MHPPTGRRQRPRPLARQFERSHLEPQLIASAYELAYPLTRRPLTSRIPTPAAPPVACPRGGAALGG
jgi:hypothetical protein